MSSATVTDAGRPEREGRFTAAAPLPLVVRLGRALDESGVAYCHWKSNAALDRSLSGENDLDLLVARADVRKFTEVLSALGFGRAYGRGQPVPGIESFYGYDGDAERWVHVHAHYALVLGDDRTKNYRLPIEDAYLRSAVPGVLRTPAPELELVVLVIRMVLKYCTWDEILWATLRGRRAGPSRSEREELEYLQARADPERVSAVLTEHLPWVDRDLYADCAATLESETSAARSASTGRRLEIALQPYARLSRHADLARRVWGRAAIAVSRRTRGAPKNRLAQGGAMVGIMGGDGAGKSTALAALESWLGAEFDVRVVHLGKPRWSLTTTTVRGALKVAVLTTRALRRVAASAATRRLAEEVSDSRQLVWLLCTARDRHHAYRHARRYASGGGLVLCDRYPHPHLTSMEVPLIASRASDRSDGRLLGAMIRLEERYHRSIAPPELLVVLRVDPEIAVARKTDERPESVRRRGEEIWGIDWTAAGAHVIDASQPQEAVARELKALVWSAIA